MAGGGGTQTTTTNSDPWDAAQPTMRTALAGANNLYNAGVGGQVYTGSTVVPWAQQTMQGAGGIQSNATANSGSNGLSGQYQDIINQGGYNDQQQGAVRNLTGIANGSGMTSDQQGAMRGMQGLASNPFNSYQTAALNNTQSVANSNFDINSNPAFMDVLRQTQGDAREAVNNSAAGAGRYGGAIHQGNVASEIGDLTSRMVGQEYNNWQGRRDAANSNLFNMGQTGINTQQGAQGSVFNMGQTGVGNRMGAANNLYQMGQGAIGNLGTAYTGMNAPNQDLMNVGGLYEDLATRQMNDRLRVFNESQDRPWEMLGRLNSVASGAGQQGGTQTQTQPGQNPFLTAIGYGASGLGALGSFL